VLIWLQPYYYNQPITVISGKGNKQMNRKIVDANSVWNNRIAGKYSVGQEVTRSVKKVVPALGVFVQLEPDFDALIHVNRIIGLQGEDPRGFFTVGQTVIARIIDINPQNHRVQLETELSQRICFNRGFLTETFQIVAQNVCVDDLLLTGALLQGQWIWAADSTVRKLAFPTNVRRVKNGVVDEIQVQLQTNYDEYLKCVHITLRQANSDVEARIDWAAWTTGDHKLGYDFASDRSNTAPIATTIGGDGYGVSELQFVVRPPRNGKSDKEVSETILWKGERRLCVNGSNWETWSLGMEDGRQAFPDLQVRTGDVLELHFKESVAPEDWKLVFFDHSIKPLKEVGVALGIGSTNEVSAATTTYRWKIEIPVTEELADKVAGIERKGFAGGLQCRGLTITAIVHKRTSQKKSILVDGSNIIRFFSDLRGKALAHLLECLKRNGYTPIVFFDANIEHVMKDNGDKYGLVLLAKLQQEFPKDTIIVPAGTRADDFMLLYADKHNYDIVSCDTFKDPMFRERYAWLGNTVESAKKRVHAPLFIHDDLVIPTLGITWSEND